MRGKEFSRLNRASILATGIKGKPAARVLGKASAKAPLRVMPGCALDGILQPVSHVLLYLPKWWGV